MFEFLRECNNYRLYERGVSCEQIIGDVNDTLIFRVFCEAAIKSIYYMEFGKDPEQNKIKFVDLLNDAKLTDIITDKYGFKRIGTLDRIIRVKGNSVAHAERPDKSSDELRIQQFMCVYSLAACIYRVRTRKNAPKITKNDIQLLIDRKKNPVDIEKIKQEYRMQLSEISAELSEKTDAVKASNAIIAELEAQKNAAIENAAKAEEQKKTLERQLKEERYKNINNDILSEMQRKIAEQESLISRYEGDKTVLEGRLARAEKANNDEAVVALQEKNAALQEKLISARAERDSFAKQLEEMADNTCNKSEVEKLKQELANTKRNLKITEKELDTAKKKLETEKSNNTSISTPLSELEAKFKDYRQILEDIEILQNDRKKILNSVNDNSPYVCPNCKSKLVLTQKCDAWRCRNWKSESEKRLWSSYRQATYRDRIFIDPILEIDAQIRQKDTLARNWLQENAPNVDPSKPIKADEKLLESLEKRSENFEQYPLSLTKYPTKSAIFQSICVPPEVFGQRDEVGFRNHSKFRVWYDPILIQNAHTVDSKERTVYSLVLRLLNRGIVLKTSNDIADKLKKKFNSNSFGKVNMLTDYMEYVNPVLTCDSERERRFAQDYFPSILGKSWASYVSSQAEFDELLPDEHNYVNCRADFLISGFSNEIRPLIVELDGYEHKESSVYDNSRRMTLRNNGYSVISYTNREIDKGSSTILNDLRNYFDVERPNPVVEIDSKYLIACKIQHQFAIAIVKALELGYVNKNAQFTAKVSTSMFSDSDIGFILDLAIKEVELLIDKYCELYGFSFDVDLKCADARPIPIFIGDGEPGYSGILVRDNYFRWDYLCHLEKFDPTVKPIKNVYKRTLQFFLSYIFGHKDFKPGQLQAIKKLLRKEDCVALLPTGSGKSIIYQLTSYLVPGLIVVISPLKSLINDQIANLEYYNGISNAIGIMSRSGEKYRERKKNDLIHMNCNCSSLLYIAPERLQIQNFRENITTMLKKNNVFAVAIDEAHCVSEWGHDFRPAYLVIGKNCRALFSDESGKPAIAALTGTASTRVREDILRTLQIDSRAVIYPDSFDRPNLEFSVIECDSGSKVENLSYIIREDIPTLFNSNYESFITRNGNKTNSGIIFTPFTKGRSKLYAASSIESSLKAKLPEVRFATYFSTPPDEYDEATWEAKIAENAKLFRENEINLLVATKAFGMGIDKGNIRFTVHDCFPSSIESFYQEAGRAGRDSKISHCVVLFSDDNKEENAQLMDAGLSLENLREKYQLSATTDDVHTRLFFHLGNFRGVKNECETVNKLIDCLPADFAPGQVKKLYGNSAPFTKDETKDSCKAIAKAVVRLMNLGIISDYLYDYTKSEFQLTLGSCTRESIDSNYSAYIKSFNPADVSIQTEELKKIDGSSKDTIKRIIELMVNYTYSQIEHGRRQQLITIYGLMLKIGSMNVEGQNQAIKDEINAYFALPKKNKNDPISVILASSEILLDVATSFFGINDGKISFDEENAALASVIAGRAAHELESASTRPDLILLRVVAQIIAGSYNNRLIANDLIAVERFSSEQYYVDPEIINESIERVYNLIIAKDTTLFDEILSRTSTYRKTSTKKLLSSLMKSEYITDDSRDYLVLKYFTDNIQHML